MNRNQQDKLKHHKEPPAVTVPINELMETIENIYSDSHELRIHTSLICGIDDSAGNCEIDFDNMEQIYLWHFEQQEMLDERRKDAIKQQGYIED